MRKIIQITSDHGYLVGLDAEGNIYNFERNLKEAHPTNKKLFRYVSKWNLISSGIDKPITGEWFEDSDLPF